jgi:glycosyltransferase involved in cell wall biosynthesis
MRLEAPDAVLLTGWNSWVLLQGLAAARSLGIPTLVRGDSNDLHQRPWVVRWLQRRLLARYQAALAVGRANRDFLVARGIGPEKIFDAPHFVDNDAIAGAADRERSQRGDLRRRWGIAPGEVCFLFAGKLIGKKRPGDLLDAFSMSPELQLGTRLLIVGDGELRSALESRAASQRLPVEFAGFLNQSEMPRSFAAADLLVLPSDAGETWGLVVNEAMAGGIPAIVSDRVGCGLDLIVEGETGWTFPCGDVRALASAMFAAAADPPALRRMGEAARRRVLGRFTIEQSVEATVSALRFLSERRR